MYYEEEIFEYLHLRNEKIEETEYVDCIFRHCTFQELEVTNCSFKGCKFEHCSMIQNKFRYCDAFGLSFLSCNIVGVNWAEFVKKKSRFLPFFIMKECTLKYNVFFGLSLKKFDFQSNHIIGCFFEECVMTDCSFHGCHLRDTLFANNNLTNADFTEAKEYQISIETNQLKNARFSFPDVIRLLDGLGIKIE